MMNGMQAMDRKLNMMADQIQPQPNQVTHTHPLQDHPVAESATAYNGVAHDHPESGGTDESARPPIPELSSFTLFNIRGLAPQTVPSKVPAICEYLHDSSQLFISLTETWLSEGHTAAKTHIDGYTLIKQDRTTRSKRRGRLSGGVAIYVRDDIAVNSDTTFRFASGVIEALGIHLKSLNMIVVVTYRQPDDTTGNHRSTCRYFKRFTDSLSDYLSSLPSPTPVWK